MVWKRVYKFMIATQDCLVGTMTIPKKNQKSKSKLRLLKRKDFAIPSWFCTCHSRIHGKLPLGGINLLKSCRVWKAGRSDFAFTSLHYSELKLCPKVLCLFLTSHERSEKCLFPGDRLNISQNFASNIGHNLFPCSMHSPLVSS
jgi:hypothetical protein